MSTTDEKIKVMQHYQDGGEVEFKLWNVGDPKMRKLSAISPMWDWNTYTYSIKKQPKLIPFTLGTFPKGEVWVRRYTWFTGRRSQAVAVLPTGIMYERVELDYEALHESYKISTDGGNTWKAAGILQ